MIYRYNSVAEFVGVCEPFARHKSSEGASWDDGISGAQACERALNGDPSIASTIDAAAYGFAPNGTAEDVRATWVPSVAGSRVDVGRYLTGDPRCMRRRVKSPSEGKQVGIYVSVGASAGIDAKTILRRGAAVMGLLEALQMMQVGVDLYLLDYMGGKEDINNVTRVESRPLDLSTAGFAIAHPAFARQITFPGMKALYGFNGHWSTGFIANGGTRPETGQFEAYVRDLVGMQPGDIFVAPIYYHDPAAQNPEAWIRERCSAVAA